MISKHIYQPTLDVLELKKRQRWWWWIVFVVWLTDKRHLTLFPARTIARDPHHRESPTYHEQCLNLCRMTLCSSDNCYTMAPLYKPLYTAFLHSIKLFEYRIAIKFDKDTFAAEQNNYLSKIVNVYIVCDWPALPRNPTNNLRFKNYLFGLTSIVKILIKKKSMWNNIWQCKFMEFW